MKQITAAVIGFGDRAEIYSKYSLRYPDELKIVAVVEPRKFRRDYAKTLFNIPDERCFSNLEDFIACGKIADCVINGTMDAIHIKTTMPLLPLGYDVLLEKPISGNEKELKKFSKAVEKYKNKVVVCHVLRYTPYFKAMKEIIDSGEIGEIKHIENSENVGFAHASIAYIRGKWNSEKKTGSSYMLAKCSHDADYICWFNSNTVPEKVSSFGSKKFWVKEKAPLNSGTKCLVDCPIEEQCPYSAKKMYIDNDPMPITVWADIHKDYREITTEEKIEALKTFSPFGKCVYKTDSDLIDQQIMMIYFSNGSTACHTLISGVAMAGRHTKIYCTKGEIEGFTEENCFYVRKYNQDNILYDERKVEITEDILDDNHYGGDSRLVQDFIRLLNGEKPSVSTSTLDKSVYSHLCVYSADKSMKKGKIVKISY